MNQPPIIIIGAGRSGTNVLRDSLCTFQGFKTWPCDEINYIWRHGNVQKRNDRFTAKDAGPEVQNYIRTAFEKFEKSSSAEFVVEKTCANSLRVPFINAIFPESKFIFLVRDGYDVASSAKKRWTASLELKYILKKARYVPLTDLPYYGLRYFFNRLKKFFSNESKLAYWGPIYPGMNKDMEKFSLTQLCAEQWKECVKTANSDLSQIDSTRVHLMRYENFVKEPLTEMRKLTGFLGIQPTEEQLLHSIKKISPRSIANHKKEISKQEMKLLKTIITPITV